jgi:hypothetical protein
MPHVIVKLWPGKSESQKRRLARAIADDVMKVRRTDRRHHSIVGELHLRVGSLALPRRKPNHGTGPWVTNTAASSKILAVP